VSIFALSTQSPHGTYIHLMRRVLISAAFSALIVAAPFVADYISPTATRFLLVALYPSLYCVDALFDASGWESFDQSGYLQRSFSIAMIALSFICWFVTCCTVHQLTRIRIPMVVHRK
jgi:hypothetical protein